MTSAQEFLLQTNSEPVKSRLRILLFVESSLGGVGNHVTGLAEGLWMRNHDVHLLYSPLRADRLFEDRIGLLKEHCPGIKLHSISIKREPGLSDLAACGTMHAYFQAHGFFDVIHAHSTKAGFLARLVLRGHCAALLYTPHAPLTLKPQLGFLRRSGVRAMEVLLAMRTDSLIAVCKDEFSHLTKLGISGNRVCVIESGLSNGSPITIAARNKIRSDLGIRETDLCIGYVGRLDTQKRPDILLRAFHGLASSNSSLRNKTWVVMAGFGPQLEELKRNARTLDIADRIIWPGEVDGRGIMTAFDVFALPSDYDTLPYSMMEALCAGLPIVTTAVFGASSFVLDGENGFVVPRRQPEAFAAALERILSSSELRAGMAEVSRSRGKHFTLDRMVDETEKLYWRTSRRDSGG